MAAFKRIIILIAVFSAAVPGLYLFPVSNLPFASAQSGSSAGDIRSDFNGDGHEDLAVGVPGEDIGAAIDAGAVNVLYGSSSGLQTSSPADQFWHQNSPGVEDTAEVGDEMGSSLG